jgi:hypothetical protein
LHEKWKYATQPLGELSPEDDRFWAKTLSNR